MDYVLAIIIYSWRMQSVASNSCDIMLERFDAVVSVF
jgi:hypothetical protein